jgi:hypothetical protein
MIRWKAKIYVELIDLVVLLILTTCGSIALNISKNKWVMLLGLFIIVLLIPYQILINKIWNKIKYRFPEK